MKSLTISTKAYSISSALNGKRTHIQAMCFNSQKLDLHNKTLFKKHYKISSDTSFMSTYLHCGSADKSHHKSSLKKTKAQHKSQKCYFLYC